MLTEITGIDGKTTDNELVARLKARVATGSPWYPGEVLKTLKEFCMPTSRHEALFIITGANLPIHNSEAWDIIYLFKGPHSSSAFNYLTRCTSELSLDYLAERLIGLGQEDPEKVAHLTHFIDLCKYKRSVGFADTMDAKGPRMRAEECLAKDAAEMAEKKLAAPKAEDRQDSCACNEIFDTTHCQTDYDSPKCIPNPIAYYEPSLATFYSPPSMITQDGNFIEPPRRPLCTSSSFSWPPDDLADKLASAETLVNDFSRLVFSGDGTLVVTNAAIKKLAEALELIRTSEVRDALTSGAIKKFHPQAGIIHMEPTVTPRWPNMIAQISTLDLIISFNKLGPRQRYIKPQASMASVKSEKTTASSDEVAFVNGLWTYGADSHARISTDEQALVKFRLPQPSDDHEREKSSVGHSIDYHSYLGSDPDNRHTSRYEHTAWSECTLTTSAISDHPAKVFDGCFIEKRDVSGEQLPSQTFHISTQPFQKLRELVDAQQADAVFRMAKNMAAYIDTSAFHGQSPERKRCTVCQEYTHNWTLTCGHRCCGPCLVEVRVCGDCAAEASNAEEMPGLE